MGRGGTARGGRPDRARECAARYGFATRNKGGSDESTRAQSRVHPTPDAASVVVPKTARTPGSRCGEAIAWPPSSALGRTADRWAIGTYSHSSMGGRPSAGRPTPVRAWLQSLAGCAGSPRRCCPRSRDFPAHWCRARGGVGWRDWRRCRMGSRNLAARWICHPRFPDVRLGRSRGARAVTHDPVGFGPALRRAADPAV